MKQMEYIDSETISVPSGDYWLGDLAYMLDPSELDAWKESVDYDYFPSPRPMLACLPDGTPVMGMPTSWDAKVLFDDSERIYPVSSRIIGLMPASRKPIEDADIHLVSFPEDTEAYLESLGMTRLMFYGNIIVPTLNDTFREYNPAPQS